jgi:hypothetical protein
LEDVAIESKLNWILEEEQIPNQLNQPTLPTLYVCFLTTIITILPHEYIPSRAKYQAKSMAMTVRESKTVLFHLEITAINFCLCIRTSGTRQSACASELGLNKVAMH